ncbi:MAG: hypothetical protein E6R03_00830 [Hyphomicrobiaceae bacterium]|nr:MAG: hypothetical protein E6R03_00830 [Hyphomicrobiaceae bacterium]
MLRVLNDVLNELPHLLAERSRWQSMDITYFPPHVERLWTAWGDYRVRLHRVYPPDKPVPIRVGDVPTDILWHPHKEPSAIYIVAGECLHHAGSENAVLVTHALGAGMSYEMVHPEAYHAVEALRGPYDSVMVTGKPYANPRAAAVIPGPKQPPLEKSREDAFYEVWRRRFSLSEPGPYDKRGLKGSAMCRFYYD